VNGSAAGGLGDLPGPVRAVFSGLKDKDLRRDGVVVGEGRLVAARIASRLPLIAIVAEASAAAEAEALAAENARRFGRGCPVAVLGSSEIASLAGYPFHRGLLAAAERPALPPLPEALPADFRRLVALPNLTDPENLGSIVRSAAALGWDAVVLGPLSCDPFGRRALRCSMAATLALPLFETDAASFASFAARSGWTVAAAELDPCALEAGTEAASAVLGAADALALVFGNEHDGIPEPWRAARRASISVPQARLERDGIDSLNVAAAAAILLWEGKRRS